MKRVYRENRRRIYNLDNKRVYLVSTLIFLSIFLLIARLFFLQISRADWYQFLARKQHQIESELLAKRGDIFIEGSAPGEETKLYPVATNKEFAFIYTVPKDIREPERLAEQLFDFFDREDLLLEIDKELEEFDKLELKKEVDFINSLGLEEEERLEKIRHSMELLEAKRNALDWQERQEELREEMLKERRAEYLERYLKRLDKPGDPYEPLKEKVEIEKLLELYVYLIKNNGPEIVLNKDAKPDLSLFNQSYVENLEVADLERRYSIVFDKKIEEVINIEGFGFEVFTHRYYPDKNLLSNLLGFISSGADDRDGHYGLEEFFNRELKGIDGYLKGERGLKNNLLVDDFDRQDAVDGSDLILSLDRNIQYQSCKLLEETVNKWQAKGGSVIAVEAKTGAILAMCSVPNYDPNEYSKVEDIEVYNNPAIFYQYEPGSVFKVITVAASINEDKLKPSTVYEDKGQIMIKGWPKAISNSDFATRGAHGLVDMNEVLEQSLNTGAIFAMQQIGPYKFSEYLKSFGFGEKTGIELGAESPGDIRNLLSKSVKEIDAATASYGQGIAVTPLQMLMSFQALANNGLLMKPYIVKGIRDSAGNYQEIKPMAMTQVVSSKTASTMLAMMINVIEKGHSGRAQIPGYYIGGKTGTAQIASVGGYLSGRYIHNFVGVFPADDPRVILLTKIDEPIGVAFAEGSALPLWRDLAEFILKYYQIPKNR